jgi:ribosomal protein S18 acetylase RimI-like enzyme
VHLSTSPANTNAQAFYLRMGFTPILQPGRAEGGAYGRSTGPDPDPVRSAARAAEAEG